MYIMHSKKLGLNYLEPNTFKQRQVKVTGLCFHVFQIQMPEDMLPTSFNHDVLQGMGTYLRACLCID